MNAPLVSVCLITYNHIKYISQAIDGVLNQKTDFKWELIIADDFSTDGTREIILGYRQKFPNSIKLILQSENVGAAKNWKDLIFSANSKYIAYFEGDDYWIDPTRIQNQVTVLENNPEIILCAGNSVVIDDRQPGVVKYFRPYISRCTLNQMRLPDLIKYFPAFQTSSTLFRNFNRNWPSFVFSSIVGDLPLFTFLASKGNIYYTDDVLSCYRLHEGGLSRLSKKKIITMNRGLILLCQTLDTYLNCIHHDLYEVKILKYRKRLILALNEEGSFISTYKEVIRYCFTSNESFVKIIKFVMKNIGVSLRLKL